MHKKLTTACISVATLAALIVPAGASAANNPQLTQPTGAVLAAGTKLKATNVGGPELQTTSETTTFTCTTAALTGELISNAVGNVKANLTSASFSGTGAGGACTGLFTEQWDLEGLPWCLQSNIAMTEGEFAVFGGACGGTSTKITFKLTGSVNCKYESTTTTVARGTYTTDTTTQDAVLSIPRTGHTTNEDAGFSKVEGGIACPSSGGLRMSFTLEKDSATAEPIYIS